MLFKLLLVNKEVGILGLGFESVTTSLSGIRHHKPRNIIKEITLACILNFSSIS